MSPRFPVFAVASAVIHAGLFLPAWVALHGPPTTAAGGAASGTGGTAAVAGETFEVPELETPPEESAPASETIEIDQDPATATASASAPDPASASAPASVPASAHRASKGRHAPSAPAAPPPPPPLYGAVGDRAAGDLVTAFRRLFPIAVSNDAQWNTVPIGFYAGGDVTFVLAADGSLTHASVSANAAPAFRTAIDRTFAALKHRVFTAKGETTRLHMVVRVTDQLTNHGAFTIDARGSFELPSGRHVAVQITER